MAIRKIRRVDETAEFCKDFFNDVVVPDLNRIGKVNDGWAVTRLCGAMSEALVMARSVTT